MKYDFLHQHAVSGLRMLSKPVMLISLFMLGNEFKAGTFQIHEVSATLENAPPDAVRMRRNRLFNVLAPNAISSNAPFAAVVTSATIAPLPEFSSAFSDLIIVGTVEHVESFLTEDRGAAYTEFRIRLSEVISNNTGLSFELVQNGGTAHLGTFTVTAPGGEVRSPSGVVLMHKVIGIGDQLSSSGKYLLFLRTRRSAECGLIMKAWDLTAGKAKPTSTEDLQRASQQSSTYAGMLVAPFLDAARKERAEQKPLD